MAILGNGATDSVIADLHAFDAEHGIAPLPVDVVHVPAGGDFSDTSGNIEWNIDMQAIHGMAPGISREVLYFAPSLADSELTAALGAWVNDPNGPPIMNASLGECEQIPILNPILNNPLLNPINGNGNPGALPVSQAVSQASEPATTQLLQQAVMEGRTFFAASGDNGSSCTVAYPGANGVANEGVPLTSDPANTPFSTGVGGTVLYSNGNEPAGRTLERAWEYSGGNASPFIRAPDYQQGVANLGHPCAVDGNGQPTNTGQLCRGVPDVAALSGDAVANGYTIVSNGQDAGGSGTSLSSPLWAGMWADVLSTAPPGATYGFANPSIYAIAKDPARYGAAFTDITAGANGLNPALGGYDYVTGFGVPRLAGLISQVQAVTGIAGRPGAAASACADRTAPVSTVRPQARRQGLAQAPVADRDRQRPRMPRPRRRARRERARGRRAAGGQALSLPEGQAGLHQAAQLLEADLPGGEGHDALALRLPRAPGQGPLQRLRPRHRRRRQRPAQAAQDGHPRLPRALSSGPRRPRAARWPPRWRGAARRSSAGARPWCARAGRPSGAAAGRGAAGRRPRRGSAASARGAWARRRAARAGGGR